MAELALHFDFPENIDQAQLMATAENLQQSLAQIPSVEQVDATPEGNRGIAEVAAAVSVAVTIASNSATLVEDVRKFVENLKKLVSEVKSPRKPVTPADPAPKAEPQNVTNITNVTNVVNITNLNLANVSLDVGFRKVPLSQLTEQDILELAKNAQS